MNRMNRKSGLLTWVAIGILLLSLSGGVYTRFLTHRISRDAETINQLGIIRGSIQRLVKLEISGNGDDEMMKRIDGRICSLIEEKDSKYKDYKQIGYDIEYLSGNWNDLKAALMEYRANPTERERAELIILSEDTWEIANNMVNSSQLISERRVDRYRFTFVFTFFHLILSSVIIFLIQRYVKSNLERMVDYDALTQLHNRSFFDESLLGQLAKARKHPAEFALILLDIDHFKRINDTFGHGAGDQVLKELSDLMASQIRKSDILSRIGGEEFSLILPDTKLDEAHAIGERIRAAVEAFSFSEVGNLTVSMGVAEYHGTDDYKSIMKRSDTALYGAKNLGRNICVREAPVLALT